MHAKRQALVRAALVLAVVAWLAFNLLSLAAYPPVTCDETFYTTSALRFTAATGAGQPWPQQGVRFFLPHGRSYWLLLGAAVAALGRSLFAARIVSLAGLAATAAATYLVGLRWGGSRRVALWSAALVGVSWLGLLAGHRARPDVWAAAASTLVTGLAYDALEADRPRWFYTLLGCVMVAQLDLHPIGIYVAAALAVLIAANLLRRRDPARLALWGLGMALGAGLLVWLHWFWPLGTAVTIPTPGAIFTSHGFALAGPSGEMLPARLWRSAAWFAGFWWGYYAWLAPVISLPQAALFVLGIGRALGGSRSAPRRLAGVIVLSSLAFALVNADYTAPPGYALVWSPLYSVLGVQALFDVTEQASRRWTLPGWLPAGVLAGLLAIFAAGDVYLAARHRAADYAVPAAQMAAAVEPGSRVMAGAVWWFGLNERADFIDEDNMVVLSRAVKREVPLADSWWYPLNEGVVRLDEADLVAIPPDETDAARVEALLARLLRPDYVVLDGVIGCDADPIPLAGALEETAARLCTPAARVESATYGLQTVYACEWGD